MQVYIVISISQNCEGNVLTIRLRHLEAVGESGSQLWESQVVGILHVRAAQVDGVVV